MIMILYADVTAEGGNIKLIARRAIPQPSGQRPVKLKNPPANGRSILRTFPILNLHTEGVSHREECMIK